MAEEHHSGLPAGYEFDGYRIESVLGSGGFGITYRAVEVAVGRAVAIKEFFPQGTAVRDSDSITIRPASSAAESEFTWGLDRFLEEARTLVRFDHPGIVRVFRFLAGNGTAYLVMPLLRGETLDARLARQERLDQAALYALLPPLLDGLATVHKAGFLHRDIKPANILIGPDAAPVLIDFGAARHAIAGHSQTLTAVVTPGFAPLEQYFGTGNQGPWTDIYALAAVLYCCVTGAKPPDSPARVERDGLLPAAGLVGGEYDAAFLQAIDRGLAVYAVDRPRSVGEWRGLLADDAADEVADDTAPAPAPEPTLRAAPETQPDPEARPASGPEPEPVSPTAAAGRPGSSRGFVAGIAVATVIAGIGLAGWLFLSDAGEEARLAEEAARVAAGEEARRAAEEEAARIAAEAETQRSAEEEAARVAAEAEARQAAEEEAARVAAEAEARQADEEAARVAAEAESRQAAEEEAARVAAEGEARLADEEAARVAAGEEARREETEEAARVAAEAESRQAEEEAARVAAEEGTRRAAEEEAARVAAEEEAARVAAGEEARRQHDLAVSRKERGDALLEQGDYAGALAAHQTALAIFERVASLRPAPGNQLNLAIIHSRIGDALWAQNDLAGVLAAHQAGLAIIEPLTARDPGNTSWQNQLSYNLERTGEVRLAQGDPDGALAAYQRSLGITERLAALDPGDTSRVRILGAKHHMVGNARLAQGDLAGALAAYQTALAIFERLTALDPENTLWQRGLSISNRHMGDVRLRLGEANRALPYVEEARALARRLVRLQPDNRQLQTDLRVAEDLYDRVVATISDSGSPTGGRE